MGRLISRSRPLLGSCTSLLLPRECRRGARRDGASLAGGDRGRGAGRPPGGLGPQPPDPRLLPTAFLLLPVCLPPVQGFTVLHLYSQAAFPKCLATQHSDLYSNEKYIVK